MYITKFIFFLFLSISLSQSQNDELPELGANNFGNEFLISMPPNLNSFNESQRKDINFIIYSPFKCEVFIEVPSKTYLEKVIIEPYSAKSVLLDSKFAQAISRNGFDPLRTDFLILNGAIRFKSSSPFALVVLSDFEETSDAILALPTEQLGNKYIISSWQDLSTDDNVYSNLPSTVTITAHNDDTKVVFTYGGKPLENDINMINFAGTKVTKTLDKGDVWLIPSELDYGDLSGSIVESSKPISVISSNQCANIPEGNETCDYIANFEIPIKYWGKHYLISKFSMKKKMPIVRVFASEDSTLIYKNHKLIDTIYKAGAGFLDEAYIEIPRDESNEPYLISGNKPIKVVAYSTGIYEDETFVETHNPFMTDLVPISRSQNEIYFSSPNARSDLNFPENNFVNLVISSEDEIIDDVEFGIIFNNQVQWEKLYDMDIILEETSISSSTFINLKSISLELPFPGEFKLRSKNKINGIVYGTQNLRSYGYPLTFPTQRQDIIDTIPPVVVWEQECEGKVCGSVNDETSPIGTTLLSDWNNFSSNLEIGDKSEMPVNWCLNVIDVTAPASATITFYDAFKNKTTSEIYYEPFDIDIEPKSISFGNVQNSSIEKEFVTITNNSDSPYYLKDIRNDLPLEISIDNIPIKNFPLEIPPLETINLELLLNTSIDTIISGNIFLVDDCVGDIAINIFANINSSYIEVSDANFQDITQFSEKSLNETIYNRGKRNLEIYGFKLPSNTNIEISGLPSVNQLQPFLIAPGKSLDFDVTISSDDALSIDDSLVVYSNAREIDSICYITARVIDPGLLATGYDFTSSKIDVDNFTFGPFTSDNLVTLYNSSPFSVEISDVEIIAEQNSDAFIFEENFQNVFIGRVLESGETLPIDIKFDPEELGDHFLDLRFEINGESFAKTELNLRGFGTRPKAAISYSKEFKTSLDNSSIINGEIRIENLDKSSWDYADVIQHFSLDYDLQKALEMGLQIGPYSMGDLIEPGDVISIPLRFTPKEVGQNKLNINFETEALLENNVIEISTIVTDYELDINFDKNIASACQGSTDTVNVNIENLSGESITIEPINIFPLTNAFRVLGQNKAITIAENDTYTTQLEFTSFGDNSEIELLLNIRNSQQSFSKKLKGETILLQAQAKILPLEQVAKPNSTIGSSISIQSDDYNQSIKNLAVIVNYDNSFIHFNESNIFIDSKYSNQFGIENIIIDPDLNVLRFEIFSLNDTPLPVNQDLVHLSYDVLLPNSPEESTDIIVKLSPIDDGCFDITESINSKIIISKDCDTDFRRVGTTGFEFSIEEIHPNPVIDDFSFDITLSINSSLKIELIDIRGELVKVISNKTLEAGKYSFPISIQDIPNGVYFIRTSSESWTDVKSFIISK